MSEYLTYAAVRTTDIESVLKQCEAVGQKLGVRFEVPSGPSSEAHTWIGVFDNGWTFALADPAVWELLDLFSRLSRETGFATITGHTDGDLKKWSYEYSEAGEALHRFMADPSSRYVESEFPKLRGDSDALSEIFHVSRAKLSAQLRQFDAPPVHDFFQTLGFEIGRASRLRFVIVKPGRFQSPSTLSVVVSQSTIERAKGRQFTDDDDVGVTTSAYKSVSKAADSGYGAAAGMKAARFGEEQDFNAAADLFFRLRRDGRKEICLGMADKLIHRAEGGEWSNLPSPHRELRTALTYGLRGFALYDLGRYDEAVEVLSKKALSVNRYMGPQHRSSMAFLLGDSLIRCNRHREALDPLRLCLAERPLHGRSWAALATACLHSGRLVEAREAVLQGIADRADLDDWTELRAKLKIHDSDLLPERQPEQSRAHRHRAQDRMRKGDKLEAIAGFRVALHHAPTDIDCAWGLACALAECIREGLLPVDPENYEPIRLLEQVAFGNPPWPWSWGTLAEMLHVHGHRDRALQACEAYAVVHVTRIEDLQNVGVWLTNLVSELGIYMLRRLLDRFVELRMKGISASADRDQVRFAALSALGNALFKAGQSQDSLQPLTEAAQIDPTNADNLATLAEVHLALGNSLAASRSISRGLRADPTHAGLIALSRRTRG